MKVEKSENCELRTLRELRILKIVIFKRRMLIVGLNPGETASQAILASQDCIPEQPD